MLFCPPLQNRPIPLKFESELRSQFSTDQAEIFCAVFFREFEPI